LTEAPDSPRRRVPLARVGAGRVLLGVCGGLGRWSGRDPALFRIAFLLGVAIGGLGLAAYAVAGAAMENPPADDPVPSRRRRWGQITGITVLASAIVVGLLLDGRLIDPGTLVAATLLLCGVSLAWRRTGGTVPAIGPGDSGRAVRIVAGLALVVAGALLFGGTGTDVSGAAAAAIAAAIVAAGAGLIFAPRLAAAREAVEEARRERIRAEEQDAMAARVHDSVLQTLALIQREGGGGRAVALARRQERELREVLYGRGETAGGTLSGAMSETAARIEARHGIRVDLVQTRDLPLTAPTEALAAAAGEALTNAAKHAGVDTVSAMVRIDEQRATVFVRDRGRGFDPAAVDGQGQGIAGSLRGRLARFEGTVRIESEPGGGTEVELSVPVGEAVK
jgi:signal transduction histidine kinase